MTQTSSDSRTAVFTTLAPADLLRPYSGTHRVQRTPANGKGRKHTSTATVAVLTSTAPTKITLHSKDLRIDRMRGSGRGGQRRNKRETAVRITHLPSKITVTRTSGRSQAQNIESAKAEIIQKLDFQNKTAFDEMQDGRRNRQTNPQRSGKDFTHTFYRDQVVHHASGKRWSLKEWQQGRLDGNVG